MDTMAQYLFTASKYVIILLSAAIIIRCIRSMLSEKYEPETWGYLKFGRNSVPITHWENIIGRGRSSDIWIDNPDMGKVHAILTRSDKGVWKLHEVFSLGGVWVNGEAVEPRGTVVEDGDVLNFAGTTATFTDLDPDKLKRLESARTSAGKFVSPGLTLFELTVIQLFILLQLALFCDEADLPSIALSFAVLIILEWVCYNAMRILDRSGFEVETIAFYLTTLGLEVTASSTPDDMYKQILLILAGIALFLISGWWMRNLKRTVSLRIPIGFLALALLALNVAGGQVVNGSANWLQIGGYSFQPSELVKVAYIYVGASTLDRLYHKRNLFGFILFSAVCVIALALIGDFGTAVVFFVCFLVVSYMRSGSMATLFLAIGGAGMAGFLAITVKPYIAQRFSSWGHVWEDVYDTGYQQTRAMSAAASGGLFGKGAGNGWLEQITAANTDMVFAMICEELGLIIGLLMVIAVLTLAFFAVRSARYGRSSYYAIAACAATGMLLTQLALNVFGSVDILPFTGVTFPFVSRGGSSLLSCWLMMAFIKSADNRRGASFAVRAGRSHMPEKVPPKRSSETPASGNVKTRARAAAARPPKGDPAARTAKTSRGEGTARTAGRRDAK